MSGLKNKDLNNIELEFNEAKTSKGLFTLNYDDGIVYMFPDDYRFLNSIKDESVTFNLPEGKLTIATNWYDKCRKTHRLTVIKVELTGAQIPDMEIYESESHVITVPSDKAIKFDLRNGDFIVAYNVRLPRLIIDRLFWAVGAHRENRLNSYSDYVDYEDTLDESDLEYYAYEDARSYFALCAPDDANREHFKIFINSNITRESAFRFLNYLYRRDGGLYSTSSRIMYVVKSIFGEDPDIMEAMEIDTEAENEFYGGI